MLHNFFAQMFILLALAEAVAGQDPQPTGMCYLANRKTTTAVQAKPTPPPPPPKMPQVGDMAGGDQGCLSAHNAIRGFLGLSGLSWDGNLAAAAYKNSQYLASIGKLRHTSAGENLASGVGSCAGAVGLWQQERPNYYGQPIGSDGRLEFYGHYTQVIWPDARRVGCGIYRGYVTCRYDSGNESGVRLYKY